MLLSLGILLATNAINVAHELGHRVVKPNVPYPNCCYCLVCICIFTSSTILATIKMWQLLPILRPQANQSVYHFWFTSVVYQYINAWKMQRVLLTRGTRIFSVYNDMLWYVLFQALYLFAITFFLGAALGFALIVG